MRRDPRVHLLDVLDAAQAILDFTEGRTRDSYDTDRLLRSAIDREFEVVGEALNRLRRDDPVVAARVPDVDRIIGFRNVLIHGYDIVDRDAVWAAITIGHQKADRSAMRRTRSAHPRSGVDASATAA